ncbi:MAG: hypothetical protein WCI73_18880, partial [Phycisphaerae bacterium]
FQMIYLDKLEPAREIKPADVASYKDKLKARMVQAGDEAWANNHMQNLMAKARLDIKDPVLMDMYQRMAAARAAATQAATQPATTLPATAPAAAPK